MWALLLFAYFITASIGFMISLIYLPSLGNWKDEAKYMLAGLFWPIYFLTWIFGFRLNQKYYLPCPALDEWEKYKINENNNTRKD